MKDVYRLDLKIEQIKKSATVALIPEFATGGIVPGPFGAPRLVLAHGGELFLGLNQSNAIMSGQTESPVVTSGGTGNGSGNVSFNVELSIGTDTQNRLFVNGAESSAGYKVIIKQVENHNRFDQLQGL